MADSKITALTSIGTITDPAVDPLVIVDVSDTSMAATGTTKKVTLNQLFATSPTATLASATITGALTANGGIAMANATAITSGGAVAFYVDTNQLALRARATNGISFQESTGTNNLLTISNAGVFGFLDGAGGTRMTLNANGLGVGGSPSYKLSAVGTTNNQVVLHVGNTAGSSDGDTTNVVRFAAGSGANALWANARYDGFSHAWRCNSTTTEAMVLNSSGNVGIGVTPSAWSQGKAIGFGSLGCNIWGAAPNQTIITANSYYNGGWKYAANGTATNYEQASGSHFWYSAANNTLGAGAAAFFTQAMTLDASGNLLVGLTVDSFAPSKGIAANASSSSRISVGHASGTSSGDYYHSFAYNSTVIGSITQNGTTGVLYNINSDYRLKELVVPLSGGLARVNALKPSTYKWKADGSSGEGFIAHELAEVVPAAVSGEKDAVNADGNIKPQGVDLSKIVPILVAAIQELTAEVNALKKA